MNKIDGHFVMSYRLNLNILLIWFGVIFESFAMLHENFKFISLDLHLV